MTSLDLFAIKERVVDILKSDTTNLWDSTPNNKTKFRKIEAGSPSPKAIQEPPLPRCWVTSDTLVATVRPLMVIKDNASKGEEYTIRLKIMFVVEAKDGSDTEEKIDDFTKAIVDLIDDNYDLRTPGGLESTRVAEGSQLTQIRDLPTQFVGDRVRGRELIYEIIVRA